MHRLPSLRLIIAARLITTTAYTLNSNFYCQPSPR